MRGGRATPRVMCALAALVVSGCGEETVTPETGMLQVTTATTGDATDADGYSVVVDGVSTAVGVSDAVTLTLDAADYSVELTGLDSPCVVDGDNPVSVTVVTDETVSVSFDVVCQSS